MSETSPTAHPSFPMTAGPAQGPKIHYDGAGNPFFQDLNGCWIPYFAQFPVRLHYVLMLVYFWPSLCISADSAACLYITNHRCSKLNTCEPFFTSFSVTVVDSHIGSTWQYTRWSKFTYLPCNSHIFFTYWRSIWSWLLIFVMLTACCIIILPHSSSHQSCPRCTSNWSWWWPIRSTNYSEGAGL